MNETLTKSLETIKSSSPLKETRVVDSISEGQFARQGDLYIVSVPLAEGEPTNERQLAPGSTQGSRHTVDASVEVLKPTNYMQRNQTTKGLSFYGPMLRSKDRFTVSHPEHADISLPAGCYQVLFQSDFASQQRARD